MKRYLPLGLTAALLVLAAWLYYVHVPKVPPAPKDLTKVLPRQLLEKANEAQLAVLRGNATSAPKTREVTTRGPAASAAPGPVATPTANGLTVTLAAGKPGWLSGRVSGTASEGGKYEASAGTLFSNGKGDVVLLRNVSVDVPPGGGADLRLPVAQMSIGAGVLTGTFERRADMAPEALQPLLKLIAYENNVPESVAQTAVLIVNDDVPLDVIASFPRLRPPALAKLGPQPFTVSPADLVAALALVRTAGIDPATTAMMTEPQLKLMTILNPDSHAAAMAFFGMTEDAEWGFWKRQLLEGDPSLRHYALYGIARYYPEVALEMLPRWVREPNVYRNYRISAAWALALINDPRARDELRTLRRDLQNDPGLRQALDRALAHWDADGKTARTTAG